MYAVIDLETTGGNPQKDKITEIAIIIHDGKVVREQYSSLINPERKIPYFITRLTGIDNDMVADAPKFFQIAKEVVELTKDHVIVAHNVNFDYQFLRSEFRSLGYNFQRNVLCTVKLSRKLIPGYKSYSLGNLCKSLDIKIKNRHRALGDAQATAELFASLCKLNDNDDFDDAVGKIPEFLKNEISRIPEKTGIYYFYDQNHKLLYIGKSINIKRRILEHLSGNSSKKSLKFASEIAYIDYQETGSELVALLLENQEIKEMLPLLNKANRRKTFSTALFLGKNEDEYLTLSLKKIGNTQTEPLICYQNASEAKRHLHKVIDRYQLCQTLCGFYKSTHGCFQFQIGQCAGACVGKEAPESYNQRVAQFLENVQIEKKTFAVIEAGRTKNEMSVVFVEHGVFKGYGYFPKELDRLLIEPVFLNSNIFKMQHNTDAGKIIQNFISKKQEIEIIRF